MSKTIPVGLLAPFNARRTALVWAATFRRPDGEVFRYCGGTRNKTISGELFTASPGFTVSNITCTEGLEVDSLKFTLLRTTDVEKAAVLAGRWMGTIVEFDQFDFRDPSLGVIPWPTYRVSDVQPIVGGVEIELRDLRQLWRQDTTLYTGKTCQNRLGDARCTRDLTGYTFSAAVTSVASRRVFTASSLGQAADFFGNGLVTFDDGIHADLPIRVQEHEAGGVITLAWPLLVDLLPGDTFVIVAGCWGRLEDCRDKFDNVLNMRAPGLHAPLVSEVVNGA